MGPELRQRPDQRSVEKHSSFAVLALAHAAGAGRRGRGPEAAAGEAAAGEAAAAGGTRDPRPAGTIVQVPNHYNEPGWLTQNLFNRLVGGLVKVGVGAFGSRVLEVCWRSRPTIRSSG
jgi:hypothetical protein